LADELHRRGQLFVLFCEIIKSKNKSKRRFDVSSLPFAYSEEYQDIISADDAYDLHWQGIILNQHAFKCPGQNCHAPVVLANMNKQEDELLQTPHFRCMAHNPKCEYCVALAKKESDISCGITERGDKEDIFLTNRPIKNMDIVSTFNIKNNKIYDNTKIDGYRKYTAKPKFYSIRPIVERYFQHREKGDYSSAVICIDENHYTYRTLFKGIMNQNIQDLYNRFHIYWGIAYINDPVTKFV
jgi:hypothetical protein